MRDEQRFCQDLTERRRTTVRFLGQQCEVTIDDTWPRAGEMRSLWKGTAEFWTDDMPQDATWRPHRHHSDIVPLFRHHVTRNKVAMFPPPPNPVISIEHGCRDSRLSAVPHTEDAEEKGRRVVLGMSELSNLYSSHDYDPSVPQNLKTLLLKQQTQAVNDRIPAKGCRHLLVKPWANGTGKGNTCQLCGAIIKDKGEITGTSKSVQKKLVTDEGKHHSSWTVEGRTELDLVQDEVDKAKRLLEEAHVEVQASPEQSNRSSIPGGTINGGDGTDQETVGGELGTSRSMRTGQKKRLLGGIKRTKAMWERWYEATVEEEKLQGSKDIPVQCVDFCEAMTSKVHAVLQHSLFDLRGGPFLQHPRVLVATVDYQENPHLCMQILHAAMFQVSRGAYIPLRVLAVTESQKTQWLHDEIQQQPSVFVLSGPATVITNIATASAFLADGWSTEHVSRVVRAARTRQENNERERAEHAYYSHIHDD